MEGDLGQGSLDSGVADLTVGLEGMLGAGRIAEFGPQKKAQEAANEENFLQGSNQPSSKHQRLQFNRDATSALPSDMSQSHPIQL